MPSTWIMSHGTAAPAPRSVAGNGISAPGSAVGNGLSAPGGATGEGLPVPGGAPADGDHPRGAPPAVRMRGVRRSFEAEISPVRALRGLDFDVAAGEFVALMGPSGCGKSTLLNVIAGLDRPDEGSVEVAGERIGGRDEEWLARFRRRHVGLIFQFFSLLDGVSVLDNLVLPGILGGMRRRAATARGRELLDLLGIGEHGRRLPSALSGGQRQRLAIARALVNDPDLLLADEPTGALDSEGGQEVLALLRRLHAGGQTIVMVTHAPEVAAGAGRIIRMRDGRAEGQP
jgi:putative ABC transport system ATP-binding protein